MPNHSPLAIANEFIRRSNGTLTQMQLQKLVYLGHGWSLAGLGAPLIDDLFQAWEFGPVAPPLYSALRQFGSRPVMRQLQWGEDTPFPDDDGDIAIEELDGEEQSVIDNVWRVYGSYPAFQLSALTHVDGSPWEQVYERGRNRVIDNERIANYFRQLLQAA